MQAATLDPELAEGKGNGEGEEGRWRKQGEETTEEPAFSHMILSEPGKRNKTCGYVAVDYSVLEYLLVCSNPLLTRVVVGEGGQSGDGGG